LVLLFNFLTFFFLNVRLDSARRLRVANSESLETGSQLESDLEFEATFCFNKARFEFLFFSEHLFCVVVLSMVSAATTLHFIFRRWCRVRLDLKTGRSKNELLGQSYITFCSVGIVKRIAKKSRFYKQGKEKNNRV
jgi:hypothetical protein